MSEKNDTGPIASTGASQTSDLAILARERVEAIVAQALQYGENTGVVIERMEHEDVFPFPVYAVKERKPDWADSNVGVVELEYPRQAHLRGEQTVFRVGSERVPDWLLGFTSFEPKSCLPEDGTIDEIKCSVVACLDDCVVTKARSIQTLFDHYSILVTEFAADFATGELSVYCHTNRCVMSVNGIMTNHRVRKAMTGKITVHVETSYERRLMSDYVHSIDRNKPRRQAITRTFVYRDRVLVHDAPQNWSEGTTYANGDTVDIGVARWSGIDELAYSGSGGDDRRRFKERAALGVRERAYAKAARNR